MRAGALRAALLAGVASCGWAMPVAANETTTFVYDELGRLVVATSAGTVNNDQAHSLCYDPAGNRQTYKSDSNGATATCSGTPSPTPTPTPTNKPPVANPDALTVAKCGYGEKNVIANDTDPDGNYPLTLTSVSGLRATKISATTIAYEASSTAGSFSIGYVVSDSAGTTANGVLTVTVTTSGSCTQNLAPTSAPGS